MKPLNRLVDRLHDWVHARVGKLAKTLNSVFKGRLSATMVTLSGAAAHLPIAWLIAAGRHQLAAVLLVIFGLFDVLDGELARVQNRASSRGMLLDASTDRFKEVVLYIGVAYYFAALGRPYLPSWAVAACGASLAVSYVKAKGETALGPLSRQRATRLPTELNVQQINRLFAGGLGRFEVRISLLIAGLAIGQLTAAVISVALLASLSALARLISISRALA